MTYPNAFNTPLDPKIITPTYDNASRLFDLKVNGATQLSEITYNPLSQVTQLKTGAATPNPDIEQYSYDAQTGLLTNQKVIKQNGNVTLLDLSYNYNRGLSKGSLSGKTGQLTNIVNNLDPNKNRVYEFDTLGRLIVAKGGVAAGGSGVANWTQNYAFDRYGNRTSVSASGVTANNQNVPTDGLASLNYQNQSNQTLTNRITTAGYEYDEAGNMLKGQNPSGVWQRFQYDSAGRLVKVMDDNYVELESYAYGASRQRLKTTVPNGQTTYYAWGGASVLCEYTETTGNSGTFKFSKSYIYAGSRLLSTQVWNGSSETTEFHHPDRLGTKLVTNNATNTFYEQSTLPFGTSLDAEFINTPTTNQKFTSYDRSAGTGLDYAVNRSYSSGQGRFTSVDPIGAGAAEIGNPQSENLYTYTENNPIDFVDPSGLFSSNPCVFNINFINDANLTPDQISKIGNYLQLLVKDANIKLVFNSPEKAGKDSTYNLNLVNSFPDAIAREIRDTGGDPNKTAGFNSGRQPGNGWINISNQSMTQIQRVAGHELGHFLLRHKPSKTFNHTKEKSIMSEKDAYDTSVGFSASEIARMKRCVGIKLGAGARGQALRIDGGGGGGDSSYRGNYDPFRSLQWLLFEQWARDGWGEPKILDDRDGWGEPKILD